MLSSELVVTIPGHPKPKGSLKCVGARGGRGHVLIESVDNKSWRETVTGWIRTAIRHGVRADIGQPLGAEITFTLERPQSHYGTGRNAGKVKASAPKHPVSHATGDVDKLLRLILDALQDTDLLPDDCAIVEVTTRKAWPGAEDGLKSWAYDVLPYPGVKIRLYPLL